jgi:hypothetical protein
MIKFQKIWSVSMKYIYRPIKYYGVMDNNELQPVGWTKPTQDSLKLTKLKWYRNHVISLIKKEVQVKIIPGEVIKLKESKKNVHVNNSVVWFDLQDPHSCWKEARVLKVESNNMHKKKCISSCGVNCQFSIAILWIHCWNI